MLKGADSKGLEARRDVLRHVAPLMALLGGVDGKDLEAVGEEVNGTGPDLKTSSQTSREILDSWPKQHIL